MSGTPAPPDPGPVDRTLRRNAARAFDFDDPISILDGKAISHTYDNGWSFTNDFEGHLRSSNVPRGVLRAHVEMVELRDGLFFVSWLDDEVGRLARIIDLEADTVIAAIPVEQEQRPQILRGHLTHGGD